MPIRKENKLRYPSDWLHIRGRILLRAGGRCEQCRLKNYSVGTRLDDGRFQLFDEADSYKEAKQIAGEFLALYGIKPTIIVLTIAHLTNPDPAACDDNNLRALCQYEHLLLDRVLHATNGRATRHRKKYQGQLALWETDVAIV